MLKKRFLIKEINTIAFDFDGVFTNNKVTVNSDGIEAVTCDKSDSLGLSMLKKYCKLKNIDLDFFIISTEKNNVVLKRAEKLKIKCFQDIDSKYNFMESYYNSKDIDFKLGLKKLLFIGNDLNDLEIMKAAKYSICPSNSHYLIKEISTLVLDSKGGDGFIREVIEILLNFKNLNNHEIKNIC